MYYGNYLVHFNDNHSSKNGQFIRGDGDGDGQIDERHRYTKAIATAKAAKDKVVSTAKKVKSTVKEVKSTVKDTLEPYTPMINAGKKFFFGIDENGHISSQTVSKVVSSKPVRKAGEAFVKKTLGISNSDYKQIKKGGQMFKNYTNQYMTDTFGKGYTTNDVRNKAYTGIANTYNRASDFYKSHKKNT